MSGSTIYVVTLTPETGQRWRGVPPLIRLRRLAKAASRAYGMRIVSITEASTEAHNGRTPPKEK